MKNTMIASYISDMFEMMKVRFPDLDEKELKKFIINKSKESIEKQSEDFKITFERHGIVINSNSRKEISLKKLDSYVAQKEPICCGYGTFIKRHDEYNNILANMIRELKKLRKDYKAEMFKHINDEDQSIHDLYDIRQKTTKVLNNSFYGATAEPNSIFYHPHFGPSVTFAGEDLVTIAAVTFENFLGNNFYFQNVNDTFNYIKNIMKEEYTASVKFKNEITKEKLLNYLKNKTIDKNNWSEVEDFFNILENSYEEDYVKEFYTYIYYKNNLYEFLDNSDIIENYFKNIIDRYDFLDPNSPPDDIKSVLDNIWNIFNDYIFYNYQDFYRYKRIADDERKVVLTIDTDSNFLYLYPYFEYFNKKFPDKVKLDNKESVVSTINIIMYQMTQLINKTMLTVTGDWNIANEFGKIINMKNEFLLKRIMLTANKKNYASVVLMQEGKIIDKPKVDVKGLAIRKVNTNKNVRNYYTKLLGEEVLFPDNINLSSIINKYKELESEIFDSLKSGDLKYAIPSRANEGSTYKFPERIMAFRGAVNWNILFPDEEINLPEKVNLVKLNIESYDVIQETFKDPEIREKFKKVFTNKNGKYVSKGFDVISIPKKVEKIPDILLPFINVDEMVNTNISPGIIILESLGFNTLDILTSQFTTNIIKM